MGVWPRRLLLALAPWPLAASCVVPALVRELPATAARRAGYLVSCGALVTGLALWRPLLLVPLGALSALATVLELAYARPGWGVGRGLPPGSLSIVPVRAMLRHDHVADLLRRHGPVAKASLPRYLTSSTVCVHGLELGARTLKQEESGRLRWPGIVFDRFIPAGFIRGMAVADHNVYRRVLRAALSDAVVEECRPELAALADGARAGLLADPRSTAGVAVRPYLQAYAISATARLFLGIVPGSPEFDLAHALLARDGPLGQHPRGGLPSVEPGARRLHDVVTRRVAEAREALAQGRRPVPSFAAMLAEAVPEHADDPNATMNLVAGCSTATRDLTGLLHWTVTMLAGAPEWQERARAEQGDVLSWIVLETLRLEQSEFVIRRVLAPVEVGPHTVPAGWYLRVCVRESHRDASVFEDPETFAPGRFEHSRFRRTEYSPFGIGRHACLGVATTMAVTEELVRAVTREYRLETTADGPVFYDQAHWRPSERQRIRFVRVDGT